MSDASLSEYRILADALAERSGEIARQYFRKSTTAATLKADHSPVTQADLAIETELRERIRAQYPQHRIIGEEAGDAGGDSRYCWILDPIDGTRAFACGKPSFTTLIGLLDDGEPVLGIIDQPITGERWVACRGEGGWLATGTEPLPLATSANADMSMARLATTSPYLFTQTQYERFEVLRRATAIHSYGGDAYQYGLLAAGHIDIVVEAGLKPYDILPLLPVLQEAGAAISDWQGNPLIPMDPGSGECEVLATANASLHGQVLALL